MYRGIHTKYLWVWATTVICTLLPTTQWLRMIEFSPILAFALIIAKALGTPGGINAKIAAAGDLAIPVLRERAKIDKEAALEAYKTSKEIQKAKIAAGAMGATEKLIERDVQNTMRMAKKEIGPDGKMRYDGLTEEQIRAQTTAPFVGKFTQKEAIAAKEAIARFGPM